MLINVIVLFPTGAGSANKRWSCFPQKLGVLINVIVLFPTGAGRANKRSSCFPQELGVPINVRARMQINMAVQPYKGTLGVGTIE